PLPAMTRYAAVAISLPSALNATPPASPSRKERVVRTRSVPASRSFTSPNLRRFTHRWPATARVLPSGANVRAVAPVRTLARTLPVLSSQSLTAVSTVPGPVPPLEHHRSQRLAVRGECDSVGPVLQAIQGRHLLPRHRLPEEYLVTGRRQGLA